MEDLFRTLMPQEHRDDGYGLKAYERRWCIMEFDDRLSARAILHGMDSWTTLLLFDAGYST